MSAWEKLVRNAILYNTKKNSNSVVLRYISGLESHEHGTQSSQSAEFPCIAAPVIEMFTICSLLQVVKVNSQHGWKPTSPERHVIRDYFWERLILTAYQQNPLLHGICISSAIKIHKLSEYRCKEQLTYSAKARRWGSDTLLTAMSCRSTSCCWSFVGCSNMSTGILRALKNLKLKDKVFIRMQL